MLPDGYYGFVLPISDEINKENTHINSKKIPLWVIKATSRRLPSLIDGPNHNNFYWKKTEMEGALKQRRTLELKDLQRYFH